MMSSEKGAPSCVVVGAGIAGLLAATQLQQQGFQVVVIDKGHGVGGRLATRRIGEAVFDHGAQFLTARDPTFNNLMQTWVDEGVVAEWCRGFATVKGTTRIDGHPRYRGAAGMTSLAKHLAHDLDVRTNERVTAFDVQKERWQAKTESGTLFVADALILTPPVPQSLALIKGVIDTGNFTLPPTARSSLEQLAYDPCIAVMALLNEPSLIPDPGAVQLEHAEPIYWIADNQRKGISPKASAVTIHATPAFSRLHWETPDEGVAQLLIEASTRWFKGSSVQAVQVKRWRYSKPIETYHDRCLFVSDPPLAFAGDAFGGPRVEGAALSGLAAASLIVTEARGSRS